METFVGFGDIKSSFVYFTVERNGSWTGNWTILPFDLERTNIGGAMNRSSGIFTTPISGIYSFNFNTVGAANSKSLTISLILNDNVIASAYAGMSTVPLSASLSTSLNLTPGDQVWLRLSGTGSIYDAYGIFYTQFSGHLLDQTL